MKNLLLTLSALLISLSASLGQAFVTTWKTDNPGSSNSNQITIPTTGLGYNYSVNWGDGNSDTGVTGNITHTYASPGTYTVSITGTFPRINFNFSQDREKILTIEEWGDIAWSTMATAFAGCTNLTSNASDAPDLSVVTSLSSMFSGAIAFNGPIGNWDVSNVSNFSGMFLNATSFNQDISGWNTSSATTMSSMFSGASSFNQPIGNWDVSNVNNISGMFFNASAFNQAINNWNVSSVVNMNNTFQGALAFNQPLNNWDVSNVITMTQLFYQASNFNQDLDLWDVGLVQSMGGMFRLATAFNGNISTWNTQSATTMVSMFLSASSFNQNIGNWNVGNVTSFSGMFQNASSFNQDLSNWDTGSATNFSAMFYNNATFNQSLADWDVSQATNMSNMLFNAGLSRQNYDATLIGWAAQSVQSAVPFGANGLQFCLGQDARNTLVNDFSWSITDAGANCIVNIPDANFKAALLANSLINTVDDGEITLQEATVFAGSMTVNNQGITDLTGIEYFSNVSWLDIRDNAILEVDLSANVDLENLFIQGNGMESIDLSHNTLLVNLFAGNNNLSAIDLSNNTLLYDVRLQNNNLTSLDLSQNTSLGVLFLDNNELVDVNLRNGNNENVTTINFNGNVNLNCVAVDNVGLAKTNWTNVPTVNVYKPTCNGGDFVNIPDTNFKAALLANTAINTTNDGEITYAEAEAFTGAVVVFGQGVSDATGIEAFLNIVTLNLQSNTISSINLQNNTKLSFLALGANTLSALDLTYNTQLTGLFANGNNLTSIDLSTNTLLDDLLLDGNELTSIDLSNNPLLERLLLNSNNLTTLDVSSNTALSTELRVDNNPLTFLDMRNIDLTQLASFDSRNTPSLTCIAVDDVLYAENTFANVDAANVFKFSCDPNDILSIPDANFKAALLANTAINTTDDGEITYGEAEAFTGTIEVSALSITDLTGIEAFGQIVGLKVSDNALTNLNVSNNPLLETLWAWNNNLTAIDLTENTALVSLILNANTLGTIDLTTNVNLQNLQLENCGLSNGVDVSTLTQLTALNVRSNDFSSIDLSDNANLSNLRIEFNALTSIDVSANTALTQLRISNNQLSSLDLSGLDNLTTLYADNNFLVNVDVAGNAQLHTLSLKNNTLSSLNAANGNNSNFVTFDVLNNPDLSCITVDELAYAEANFTSVDEGANFSTDCSNVANDITAFSFAEETGPATIDAVNHTIDVEVVLGTDLTNLIPTFTVSTGASASPSSGVAQDFSSLFVYTLTAENPTAIQEWTVNVSIENVAPTDIILDNNSIDENNAIAAVIGTLSSTDGNTDDTHTYSLVAGAGDTDNSSFSIVAGAIQAAVSFDFETQTAYSIRVRTEDSQGASFEKVFSISINDLNNAAQTIEMAELPEKAVGDADFALTATASSGLAISYTSSNESVAIINGTMVTVVGAGSTSIRASQAGNEDYAAAVDVERTLIVKKLGQTIQFAPLEVKTFGDAAFTLGASATSALEISYTSSDESVAVITGNSLTIVGAGSAIITASQLGNEEYAAAFPVEQTLVVNKASQSISFEALAEKTYGDGTFEISASASSGLSLVFSSSDENILSIHGTTVTLLGAGTVSITATQEGNENYLAATAVEQVVNILKANQSISVEPIATKFIQDEAFEIVASSSSALPLVYAVLSGPAALEGNLLTLTGTVGVVQLQVSQEGDNNYLPASVELSFEVINPCDGFAVALVEKIDNLCPGTDNGSITVQVIGGTEPYTFSWAHGAGSQNLTSLAAGDYTLTVTDANACTVSLSASITEPEELAATFTVQPQTDGETPNGSIDLSVSGGTAPYTFAWNNESTEEDQNGLSAGNYSVSITDANGCTVQLSITVANEIEVVSGIAENTLQLQAYPNPVKDYLMIHTQQTGGGEITLLNLQGQTVQRQQTESLQGHRLDMSGLRAGTYLLQIQQGSKRQVLKIQVE